MVEEVVAGASMGRVVWIAGLVGTVLMLGIGVGMSLVGGTSFIDALGIGAFAAVWGGPGFGGMAGGIYYISREDQRARANGTAAH